jgi:hypothetical protein
MTTKTKLTLNTKSKQLFQKHTKEKPQIQTDELAV